MLLLWLGDVELGHQTQPLQAKGQCARSQPTVSVSLMQSKRPKRMFRWYGLISIESLMKDWDKFGLQCDIVHTNPGLRVHQNLQVGHFASMSLGTWAWCRFSMQPYMLLRKLASWLFSTTIRCASKMWSGAARFLNAETCEKISCILPWGKTMVEPGNSQEGPIAKATERPKLACWISRSHWSLAKTLNNVWGSVSLLGWTSTTTSYFDVSRGDCSDPPLVTGRAKPCGAAARMMAKAFGTVRSQTRAQLDLLIVNQLIPSHISCRIPCFGTGSIHFFGATRGEYYGHGIEL